MLYIQIILILIFVLAIIKVIARFRDKNISIGWLVFWLLFWVAGIGIVAVPNSTFYFANMLGIGRGADLVVYLALVLIFFLFFQLLIKIGKMDKEITKLTRKIALISDEKDKRN